TGDLDRLGDDLAAAVDALVFSARRRGLTMTERTAAQQARRAAYAPSPPEAWEGSIVPQADGTFRTVAGGGLEPFPVPKSAATELRTLLALRDRATGLLAMEAATVDDTEEI